MSEFKNITLETLDDEHVCCAISDKKHQRGVEKKKAWLRERLSEGHVFKKLDVNGKVFIEYSFLENIFLGNILCLCDPFQILINLLL